MKNNKSLFAAILVALLVVAGAAYWYWSPFLAVRELQSAAQKGDADAFNAHVDYPRVRESLKLQLSAMLAEKLGASKDPGNPMAALGNLLGAGLVNQLVDTMVRPETVMAAMQNGVLTQRAPRATPGGPSATQPGPSSEATPPSPSAPAPQPEDRKTRWIIDRQGASRMTAYAVHPERPDEPKADRLGLAFERSGFADWKLTDIRLPASALRK